MTHGHVSNVSTDLLAESLATSTMQFDHAIKIYLPMTMTMRARRMRAASRARSWRGAATGSRLFIII